MPRARVPDRPARGIVRGLIIYAREPRDDAVRPVSDSPLIEVLECLSYASSLYCRRDLDRKSAIDPGIGSENAVYLETWSCFQGLARFSILLGGGISVACRSESTIAPLSRGRARRSHACPSPLGSALSAFSKVFIILGSTTVA